MRAYVVGFGLVAAGLGLVFLATRGDSREDAPAETAERHAEAPSLRVHSGRDLAAGTEHRYAVTLESASRPSEGESFALGVDGEWALAVLPSPDTTTTIRAELRNARIELRDATSPAPRLAVPYTFTLAADGKLIALQFPPELDPDSRVLLTSLTATAQLTHAATTTWTTVETDTLGPYDARYTRGETGLHRSKLDYRKSGDAALAVRIAHSTTDFAMRADGWPSKIEHREELGVGLDKVSVGVTTTMSLRHVGLTRGVIAVRPSGLESVAVDAMSTAAHDEADRELLDGATLVDLLATLAAIEGDGNASAHTYLRLVALFRLDPAAARAGAEMVTGNKVDKQGGAAIVGALGEAGTPEAQRALVGVVATTDVLPDHRVHGAMSLGLTESPLPETINALTTASQSGDPELSATATLALGNAALRMHDEDTAAAARQVDELLARLARAVDPETRVTLLRALGNTGDVRVLPALEAALASDNDTIRAAATESLRLIPDARADALVIVALDDRSAIVRSAAVFTATMRPIEPLVHALAVRARIDDDVTIRRAIVELAGTRMAEAPAALRPIVAHAAERDADAELRKRAKELLS